jgi:hypothetical protein
LRVVPRKATEDQNTRKGGVVTPEDKTIVGFGLQVVHHKQVFELPVDARLKLKINYRAAVDSLASVSRDVPNFQVSLSEILCVRHNMSPRSMYAKQDEQEARGSGAAQYPERTR